MCLLTHSPKSTMQSSGVIGSICIYLYSLSFPSFISIIKISSSTIFIFPSIILSFLILSISSPIFISTSSSTFTKSFLLKNTKPSLSIIISSSSSLFLSHPFITSSFSSISLSYLYFIIYLSFLSISSSLHIISNTIIFFSIPNPFSISLFFFSTLITSSSISSLFLSFHLLSNIFSSISYYTFIFSPSPIFIPPFSLLHPIFLILFLSSSFLILSFFSSYLFNSFNLFLPISSSLYIL